MFLVYLLTPIRDQKYQFCAFAIVIKDDEYDLFFIFFENFFEE